jgi:serine/threonine protein kinase
MAQKYRNALPIGYEIGNFRIEKILGQGGFGITYLARDEKLDRNLAIKEYFPSEFSKREDDNSVYPQSQNEEDAYRWGLERFLNEGKTLAKFKHPNIVRVIDYLEYNNTAYIIMEYEHGRDLQSILKERKKLDLEETLNIFLPLLNGLSLVHKEGFIHRDIKPANIFIRENGSPVLIDFGSARQGMATKTKTLTTLVSPGYAPFEQYNADSSSKQGPWTDIYAMGASMYRTLFGRSPLDAVSRAEKRLSGQDDPYLSAVYIGKDHYRISILESIDKALAFMSNDRPQTIEEWIDILQADTPAYIQNDDEETVKIEPIKEDLSHNDKKQTNNTSQVNEQTLRLAITQYIVIGMLTLWSYTAFMLTSSLIKYCSNINEININNNSKFIFSGAYILVFLLVLSWIVPNVFMGQTLGEKYILIIVFISALIFYVNTFAFVLWFMKKIKNLDKLMLNNQIKFDSLEEDKIKTARNKLIVNWEKIDNNIALFLIISLPIIFSPYVSAKLFFSSISEYLLLALPVIVMSLGGLFHVWGTRLLINTYNNTLCK